MVGSWNLICITTPCFAHSLTELMARQTFDRATCRKIHVRNFFFGAYYLQIGYIHWNDHTGKSDL